MSVLMASEKKVVLALWPSGSIFLNTAVGEE